MGAGLRDAMNLAWKLAGVLGGDLPDSVLDTYEAERKPHVRALIRRAKLMGTAMTAGGEAGALVRRVVAPRLQHLCPRLPAIDILHARHRPCGRSDLAPRPAPAPHPGRPALPQRPPRRAAAASTTWPPAGSRSSRSTEPTAGTAGARRTARRGPRRRPARQRAATAGCAGDGARAAIVRPDGTVLRAGRDLAALCAALPAFTPARRAESVPALV